MASLATFGFCLNVSPLYSEMQKEKKSEKDRTYRSSDVKTCICPCIFILRILPSPIACSLDIALHLPVIAWTTRHQGLESKKDFLTRNTTALDSAGFSWGRHSSVFALGLWTRCVRDACLERGAVCPGAGTRRHQGWLHSAGMEGSHHDCTPWPLRHCNWSCSWAGAGPALKEWGGIQTENSLGYNSTSISWTQEQSLGENLAYLSYSGFPVRFLIFSLLPYRYLIAYT